MALSFNKRVTVPEHVMFRELEGEAVILNLDTDSYFGLDDVGTRIWLELTSSDSIQSAFENLKNAYDVSPDLLRRDLIELIEKLIDKGLVRLHESQ